MAKTKETKPKTEKPKTEMEAVLAHIRAAHGENTVVKASRMPDWNAIPTGVFLLDMAMFGGWREGSCHMVYGFESSGKTLMCLKAVAAFLKKHPDKQAAWIALEGEGSFDKRWAEKQGVDTERLLVFYPKNGELGVDVLVAMMDTLECGFVVADGIAGFVPQAVVDRSAEDDTMGALARLMGKLSSKVYISWATERERGHRVTVMFTNQYRMKLGFVMGDPKTLPGGRQINHLAQNKVALSADKRSKEKKEQSKEKKPKEVKDDDSDSGDDDTTGVGVASRTHRFKLDKVRAAEGISAGEFEINYLPRNGKGLTAGEPDEAHVVVTYAKKYGLITGGGGHWNVTSLGKQFSKREALEAYLLENPEDFVTLKQETLQAHRLAFELPALPPDGYLVAPTPKGRPKEKAETGKRRRR